MYDALEFNLVEIIFHQQMVLFFLRRQSYSTRLMAQAWGTHGAVIPIKLALLILEMEVSPANPCHSTVQSVC